jgi:hypothetical protein
MNVPPHPVITVEPVLICPRDTDVTALKDIVDLNVMRKNQIAMKSHAQTELCAKMSQALEISHVCVNLDTPEMTVTLVSILVKLILVLTELSVKVKTRADLDVYVQMAGMAHFVTKTSTIVLRNPVYWELNVLI